jgi:hypothetical protein
VIKEKKEYNLKMKEYRDKNKFLNAYHCHNYKRRNFGFDTISINEYLDYRIFIKENVVGKLKSSRVSNIKEWEIHKKTINLIFKEPKKKGNFTLEIKRRIQNEFN